MFFLLLENRSRISPFFWSSWRLSGAILRGFLAVLGLSWEASCSKKSCKNQVQMHVFKMVCYRYLSSLGPLPVAILAHFFQFQTPKWGQRIFNIGLTNCCFLVTFWISFGMILGAILGFKISSKMEPKVGPVLESDCSGFQGSGSRQNWKQTRGVEKGKLLEIYSAKEREGFCCLGYTWASFEDSGSWRKQQMTSPHMGHQGLT